MGLPARQHEYGFTYADYLGWPEGERWELIDGEAFAMSPAPTNHHQLIVGELFAAIHEHLRGKPCRPFVAPFDVRLPRAGTANAEVDTVVQPDISVVCDPDKLKDNHGCLGAPDWVIEVLSPGTAVRDQRTKRALYEHHGVAETGWCIPSIARSRSTGWKPAPMASRWFSALKIPARRWLSLNLSLPLSIFFAICPQRMTRPDFSHEHRRHRLLMLAVVLAAYVLSFFQRFAPAGIAPDLAASFQTSAASLGVLAATYFYVYTIMQVPTGILVDTLGPRRILALGGVVAGGGSLLFALAGSLDGAMAGRTLVGLGVSVVFIAMLKIIAVWFDEGRFATVVGISMLVGNSGSVLAGAPLSWLAQTTGWRGVFVGVGLVSIVLGGLCWLLVRDRPATRAVPLAPTFDRTVILTGLLRVVNNRATWVPTLVNFGLSGIFAFGGLWAIPFLTQVLGMSRVVAANHLSLYFVGFALGCLIVGSLSDRIGRRKPVLIVGSHIYGLIWLFLLLGRAPLPAAASFPLLALMGLMTASFTLTWACTKEVNPPALSGMSTSVTNMGGFLAGAVLQPLVGWVMDQHWQGALENGIRIYLPEDYRWGLLPVAVAAWLGAAATWKIRETNCRNIWRESK